MKVQNDFSKGQMWRVILRMALPMMLAQLVNVLYNIVDRMYIGHMADVGALALTGLGLCMPIISLVTACASLCGVGGGPLCSIARGRGDLDYAERVMGNAFALLLALGVALTIGLELSLRPVLYLLRASDVTYPYAAQYVRIYLVGTVFVMVSLGMNYFINAQGFARIGMLTVTIGAVLNIILDPIFIFALDMGISGAALATVISQAASAVWAMQFLLSRRAILDLKLKNLMPRRDVLPRILKLGMTGFVMNITNCIVQIASNVQLAAYGGDLGDLYIGAMTVINSVHEVPFMVNSGLRDGAQPVISYNYGAGIYSRVKQGIRFLSCASVAYAGAMWLCIMLFTRVIVSVFNSEPAMLTVAVPSMRIYFCGFIFMSLMMAGQGVFLSLGRSGSAVTFSLLRKIVIVVPLIFLLPGVGGMGAVGVFWAEPISDLVGGAACYLAMYFTVYRKLGADQPVRKEESV
ncbi:MAG: MATE family efflux transporter [Oscillospiraceae bacterium]|nr:MATE family efflux transporter [Oscillospiraceae bacterium]